MPTLIRSFSNHIFHNDLIHDNDKILLAVSGGIDSLVMAHLFAHYQKKSSRNIKLQAAHIDIQQVSIGPGKLEQLREFFEGLGIDLQIIFARVDPERKYNCYSCSKERRKQLFTYYDKNDFSAIAFGHHRDDLIETGFMNLINHGNLETLKSLDLMFDGVIKVIRPLLAAPKKNIRHYANQKEIKVINKNECRYGLNSKRSEVRKYIRQISQDNKAFKKNLYSAILEYNDREY